MVVSFSNIDFSERPILILKNASDTPLGVLGYAKNVSADIKYNETSSIEFEVPAFVDGEPTPLYGEIIGMRTLELRGVGQFTLVSPKENNDGVQVVKTCKGYSLEYEFVYKKLSLPKNTYKFWDDENPQDTLLGMIMELMPSWNVGYVPISLQNKYRTFEVTNENLYNLIKGTVQKSYGCIFDFDTITRSVYVRDASDTPVDTPVYISPDNLAKELEITENTEDIFTRIDVNGAEGVSIRDVNPTGTNKIVNLDYYMTEDNFSPALIEKYNAWKDLCSESKHSYYTLSVQYAVNTSQKVAEMAMLTDLRGEMTSLENLQAVAIEGIARGLKTQADLDEANAGIAIKQTEIDAKQSEINALQDELELIHNQLRAITEACNFEGYFTEAEYKLLDRYIKDGEIEESSFVVAEVQSYDNVGVGESVGSISVTFDGGSLTQIESMGGGEIYDIKGGNIAIANDLDAKVISAVIDRKQNGSFIATAYLSSGMIAGKTFPSGCVSLTSDGGDITVEEGTVSINLINGYRYFTLDATEYEKRSVAWELYEYGVEALSKLATPSYSFKVTSANFLSLDEFATFKNALTLGEKVYLDMGERGVLRPIVIGVSLSYDNPESVELSFSDSYTAGDSTFRLIDLLEQSISMGKNVEMSKFTYSSFVDSGASSELKEYMTSALDVARNSIMSSTEQALSWDGAGFRLRRWADELHTAYDPEQIWMNNNSIVMTDDAWATAEMAIGKFYDENLGDCWGIVAPRVVGTLLAGSTLVIESAKKDGGTSLFRVDGDGCYIHNSDISVCGEQSHIILNPDFGFAIGSYPIYSIDEETGAKALSEEAAKFWVDTQGNLHMKGTLHGANGDFTGDVSATSLNIQGQPVDTYVDNRVDTIAGQIQDGTTGIFFSSSDVASLALNRQVGLKIIGADETYFQVKNDAMGFFRSDGTAMLYYDQGDLVLTGIIAAHGGYIGGLDGWVIDTNCMYNGGANELGSAGGIYMGATGISVGSAIVMKPDGSFIIRGDNTTADESNYVLKISPSTTADGDEVYSLHLGNIIFAEGFVLPPKNGGTGGSDSNSVGSAIGLYHANTVTEMQAIPDASNGALCVLSGEGVSGTSIAGSLLTSTLSSPGYLSMGEFTSNGHRYANYFNITDITYWNITNFYNEDVSNVYARVGVGETVGGACGLYMPLQITVSGSSTSVTSVTVHFSYSLRPLGCSRDLCTSWDNPICATLFSGSDGARVAHTTYSIPEVWRRAATTVRNTSITFNCASGITSGEYYIAFYTRSVDSLMWIQHNSISVEGRGVIPAAGLYMKSNDVWKAVWNDQPGS